MDNETIMIRIEIPATFQHLHVIDGCVKAVLTAVSDLQNRDVVTYNVELAVHETCTNIVEHAYAQQNGRIEANIALESGPRRLVVDLYDTGRAFDISTVSSPNLDEPQEAGYGLFLVHNLMDEVMYKARDTNNHWQLIKHL